MKLVSARVPDSVFEAVQASAAGSGKPKTSVVRDLIEAGLARPEASGAGRVESKVREDVEALVSTHPMGEAIAEMSYALARNLDEGAGLAIAAVNRELRANLVELARGEGGDDDDDFSSSLPAALQYGED